MESEDEKVFVNSLALKSSNTDSPFYSVSCDERPHIDVIVKGRTVRALVDSGSQMTIISENLLNDPNDWCDTILPTKISMLTVDRSKHAAKGMMLVDYTFQNQTHQIATVIMPIRMEVLLVGSDFMKQFGIKLECHIETKEPKHESAQICYIENNHELKKSELKRSFKYRRKKIFTKFD